MVQRELKSKIVPNNLDVSSNSIHSARCSFEPETLRSVSSCQHCVRDATTCIEPLPHSQTHGIWVIKSGNPKATTKLCVQRVREAHRGQTALLCVLTAIFVERNLRCSRANSPNCLHLFQGCLKYGQLFQSAKTVLTVLVKGWDYIWVASSGVPWFYKVVPNRVTLQYLNLLKPTGHVMHQQFDIQQL